MEDSFGSDYIYNYQEQMKNLQAQADAYQKMADAERSKGRKADDDKIKEYEESMDDILEKMDDMKHQLSEYFSGTDLTSAAEDFAKSWIDAYREFSSTTSAMKEKFKEMIDNTGFCWKDILAAILGCLLVEAAAVFGVLMGV